MGSFYLSENIFSCLKLEKSHGMRIKICVVGKASIFRKKSLANDPPLPPTFGTLLPNLGKGEGGVENISSQPDPTAAPPGGYPSSAPSAAPLAAPINSSDPL